MLHELATRSFGNARTPNIDQAVKVYPMHYNSPSSIKNGEIYWLSVAGTPFSAILSNHW